MIFIHFNGLVTLDQKSPKLKMMQLILFSSYETTLDRENGSEIVSKFLVLLFSSILYHRLLLIKKSPKSKTMRMIIWFSIYIYPLWVQKSIESTFEMLRLSFLLRFWSSDPLNQKVPEKENDAIELMFTT